MCGYRCWKPWMWWRVSFWGGLCCLYGWECLNVVWCSSLSSFFNVIPTCFSHASSRHHEFMKFYPVEDKLLMFGTNVVCAEVHSYLRTKKNILCWNACHLAKINYFSCSAGPRKIGIHRIEIAYQASFTRPRVSNVMILWCIT